jgi:glucose-1-phosphate cytidylyltransferase
MKVVLFCGGLGMRLREHSESIPKPMVEIGYRPILWHVMKYYAYYGHKEFILCLGHQADVIKKYFLNYDECISNNFVLSKGAQSLELLNTDIGDWRITFIDTGLNANIGQRLRAVQKYLEGDDVFMANYADGLTDLVLPEYLASFEKSGRLATFLAVKPTQSFHVVTINDQQEVTAINSMEESDIWINGGYFIFRKGIFDFINEGEELIKEPFRRLIQKKLIMSFRHRGFWVAMDTFKDKQFLDDLVSRGNAPWQVWNDPES